MEKYLDCKKIETAISRAKKILIDRAKKEGIYENFGQKEVRDIEDKFIDCCDYTREMMLNRGKLNNFNNWCMEYTNI